MGYFTPPSGRLRTRIYQASQRINQFFEAKTAPRIFHHEGREKKVPEVAWPTHRTSQPNNSSSSSIMSLKDLAQCINIQNEAIKRLPPEGIASEGTICKLWDRFRIEFWGRDLESLESSESVQRGEDQVQDDILPEQPPPASRTVVKFSNPPPRAWILPDKSGTFLVRPEYHKAEKAALSVSADRTCKLFLVNGTPGIGMILFLSPDRR